MTEKYPSIPDIVVQEIAKFLGGLFSWSEITLAFERCNISYESSEGAKWRDIYATLQFCQLWDDHAGSVLSLISDLLSPARYARDIESFEDHRQTVNAILRTTRIAYTSDGDFVSLPEQQSVKDDVQVDSDSIQEVALETDRRNVFVVHGRNQAARDAMFAFLRAIDLHPMEWSEARHLTGKASPYIGEILDSAFSHARAVVVLFTPDDEARLRTQLQGENEPPFEVELTGQARPNVLFEAGIAMGRDQNRTVLVELGSLRPFSDIGGRHTVRLDNSTTQRHELARRLESAGCSVNRDGVDWYAAGDFEASLEALRPSSAEATDDLEELPRATIQTQLSADGVELFLKAVQGDRITKIRSMGGTSISAGGMGFVEVGNRRSEARWESALSELVDNDLVQDPTGNDRVFEVTHKGYETAEDMETETG